MASIPEDINLHRQYHEILKSCKGICTKLLVLEGVLWSVWNFGSQGLDALYVTAAVFQCTLQDESLKKTTAVNTEVFEVLQHVMQLTLKS
jgi:hypothetical protein